MTNLTLSKNWYRTISTLTILATCKYELNLQETLEWERRKRLQNPAVSRKAIAKPARAAVPRDLNWFLTQGWIKNPEARRYDTVIRLASILSRLESLDTVKLEPAMVWENQVISQHAIGMDLRDVHFIALMAMARSSTPVSTLDVFRDPAFSGFSFGGLGDALSVITARGPDSRTSNDTTSLARFLQFTPYLRQFDLDLRVSSFDQANSDEIFVAVANDVYLPRLEDCRLSGFILRNQESIWKLFTKHSKTLERVSLSEMDADLGTWELVLRGFGSREASDPR